jgi:uncharacterized membrane protein
MVTSAGPSNVSELPTSAGQYSAFTDILILGDLNLNSISADRQQAIVEWVRSGGALVVTGGDANMSSGKISEALPVSYIGDSWGIVTPRVDVQSWYRAGVTWSDCPGWSGFKRSRIREQASSVVLATSVVGADSSSSYPLVVTCRLGSGRIVVFTSDLTSRWGRAVLQQWGSAGKFYASLVDAAR